MLRLTHVVVDLPAIAHNVTLLRRRIGENVKYCAVVKANAYGHGIVEVSKYLLEHGVDVLGVAITEEGIRLREAGITAPILIVGSTPDCAIPDIIRYDLMPTVFSPHTLLLLQACAETAGQQCAFHFKVDTGMHRIGFVTVDDFNEALDTLKACPNLHFAGLYTHFAVSELADKQFTMLQYDRFNRFRDAAYVRGYRPTLHISNSGALLDLPVLHLDMVRGGIVLYGYHPIGHAVEDVDLRPALTWKTEVSFVKDVPAGEGVSYGLRFVTTRPSRIATLPVGYGDGYKRCMSNHAEVLIHGVRVPQIGTVCMDQMMCDVTDVPNVNIGDEVILLGRQGEESITADEMAGWADTISYEILLSISERVPRVYLYD